MSNYPEITPITHSKALTAESDKQTENNRWEQMAAAGGIFYVILQLVSQMLIQVGGSEPSFDASAAAIADYFMNRSPALATTGGFLSTLSTFALFGFLGALWAALKRREGEPGWMSLITFSFGVVSAAILLGGGDWELAILRLGDGRQAETMQLLFDRGNLNFANLWVSLSGMLFAAGIVALRDRALPRWLGWYSLLVAAALLAVRPVWFTAPSSKFLPYMLFWIWLIATSIVLMRKAHRNPG
ncbi:MAG: hypothetical protein R3293_09435 [Candidatus Promineifilaceae bacterium]|nr:hypothetical protein [Candidatus Promineifilaceae bacterium]